MQSGPSENADKPIALLLTLKDKTQNINTSLARIYPERSILVKYICAPHCTLSRAVSVEWVEAGEMAAI